MTELKCAVKNCLRCDNSKDTCAECTADYQLLDNECSKLSICQVD